MLERSNATLESRVQLRTKKLAEANRALRSEAERRRTAEQQLLGSLKDRELLSTQLIQAQESERRRIAAELHDSVGQSLSAIKFTLERAAVMLQRPELGDPEPVIALALQRIAETSEGIRAISTRLRPQMLDIMGAASATAWFCRDFGEVYGTLQVRIQISAANSDIPDRIATHLYRCVQELLNNVAKHANAKKVSIVLRRKSDVLQLLVTDDGVGLSLAALHPERMAGSGLRNLRERAEMTGGRILFSSPSSGGTAVEISWILTDEDVEVGSAEK
jgi:signal transduction histidine kinase